MEVLSQKILEHAVHLEEGTPLVAKELLHLGTRAAIDQALSRLVKRGSILRAGRGLYVLPVAGRFGVRSPSTVKMVEALARQRGEIIVRHGAAAANALGLTTQVPTREVYLTSGTSKHLQLGSQRVELRHAPSWQLVFPNSQSGEIIRAMAWMGPEGARHARARQRGKVPKAAIQQAATARARLPTWLAEEVSAMVASA